MHRVRMRARSHERFVYSGQTLLVTDLDGRVTGSGMEGFYHENTRLLSRDELIVHGKCPRMAGVSAVGGAGLLGYAQAPEGEGVPRRSVLIRVARYLDDGMRTEISIENHSPVEGARFDLAVCLAADFADIKETLGDRRQTGDVEASWDEARGELTFRYRNPDLDRAVAIRVLRSPAPVRYEGGSIVVPVELRPHESAGLHLAVEPIFDGQRRSAPPTVFDETATPLGLVRQQLRDETPRLSTSNATVSRAWDTATGDLASLPLGLEWGPAAPIAGIPLYQYFFGRDTLTIAWQALMAMPTMARDALRANAALQGTTIDDWLDEEPGKLIHQARQGPLPALGITPYSRYYGDYAAPQDFLILLGQYLSWTNDLETVRELLPAARKVIEWLERYGDLDGDGFLEYVTRSGEGVKNHGWKDSKEAIVDEHGRMVANPIAVSEVQAYWYVGLQMASLAFFVSGDRSYAFQLLRKARDLSKRFDEAYWMEDEGYYALALGPDKSKIRSIASNPGHLLATGIVPREKGVRVAQRLMGPDLFSGWGIRTLSSNHVAYNPFTYHLGSVWPVDTGTFSFGFGRYGCIGELHRLTEGTFSASDLFEGNRLPESLGGLPRDAAHPHMGIYPEANEPQGWSASTIVLMVQSLLGIRPMAPLGLLVVDPYLPEWLPELRLEGIRVGKSRVDLDAWRTRSGRTKYRVSRREGSVRVIRQPPPQAPGTSITRRTAAALGSLFR